MSRLSAVLDRRAFLSSLAATVGVWPAGATDTQSIRLPLPGGPNERALSTAFPGKGAMILQRTRPPLLETPLEVFDQGVFTPNDRFFVRWHWAEIPTEIDAAAFRLRVRGHVERELSLSLDEIGRLPHVEIAAVNQCSGNSRGLFEPRVPGAQWAHGSMGNARWMGVRLKDLLDRAGVRPGAVQVRFDGLDAPVVPEAPDFRKSLNIDHARDGEVMVAFAMNGEQLPLLNGFPLRLLVPGWYSTYWVKMLSDIEVLAYPDGQFWMKVAYRIPNTPGGSVRPSEIGYQTMPISRMVPRAFLTNLAPNAVVKAGAPLPLRGIALGGDCGVKAITVSSDGGRTWLPTRLGSDEGRYSFRRFDVVLPAPRAGQVSLIARCTNAQDVTQPLEQTWNPNGFMRGGVETVSVTAA
ncbi:molybdopterin-dependent oxidoreductase [Methylobacterium sp. NEAU K]|uniref:molybdopterin-dependent oxidoreductase n=1 Tax=Methylobacterium sp. NEAU K TaxID=3064946 RepID=UPI00273603FC|nr:molybdopterin-dependent oxidoreductase [Methylobacterium sp. NEAU K]MDP4004784.1 molybdopterin-dependent oxidoreductase [Methylobacterium sp. NEAU K]